MVPEARGPVTSRIPVSRPWLGAAEEAQVLEVLRSGWLTRGPKVGEFERRLAQFLGVEHAIAVNSGTAALHLALAALGAGPGDAVIIPDFTFPATANAVRHCGAEPILVDVELETFNLSLEALQAFLGTKAEPTRQGLRWRHTGYRIRFIVPVHLFGLPVPMDPIRELAETHGLTVVEDAACALGARDGTRLCGTIGDVGCFSFHPRKVITTGEGGLVVTGDAGVAERVRSLRNHGMNVHDGKAAFTAVGYNYRMSDVHAAIGVAQMESLDFILRRHAEIAAWYDERLDTAPGLQRPKRSAGRIYQAYVVWLEGNDRRDRILAGLRESGIECVLGTYAISAQPAFKGLTRCLNSVRAQEGSLALPLHPGLDEATVDRVCTHLRRLLAS